MAKLSTIKKAHRDPYRVSASGLATIAGLNKYQTPLELYLEKTGQLPDEEDSAGEAAYWGLRLEAMVLAEWAQRNGEYVLGQDEEETLCLFTPKGDRYGPRHKGFRTWLTDDLKDLISKTQLHPTLPIMCHLDGIGLRAPGQLGGLLQAKTASVWKRDEWGAPGSDQMPPHYLLQTQTELVVLEAVVGRVLRNDVPVLLGGQEYRQYTTTLNPRVGELIGTLATDFVQRVRDRRPPDPTEDAAGTRALQKLYSGDGDVPAMVAEPGTDLWVAAQDVIAAKVGVMQAEAAYEAGAARIQAMMGDATKVKAPFGTISWSSAGQRNTTAWKAMAEHLAEQLPEHTRDALLDKYTTTKKGGRSFRVTPKETNDDE